LNQAIASLPAAHTAAGDASKWQELKPVELK
jgi:hypothetical protein